MHFTAFAISPIPDTETARKIHQLDDLDEKSVGKVLFHRRRQQAGTSERLRWNQQTIASLTLIRHSINAVRFESVSVADMEEREMLKNFFSVLSPYSRLISWGGNRHALPLIHMRSMKKNVVHPPYWNTRGEGGDVHLDLAQWLSPTDQDRPTLDEISQQFFYPGLLGRTLDNVWDAYLEGDFKQVRAYSDYRAISTYLLALNVLGTTGELSGSDAVRARNGFRESLATYNEPHLQTFLKNWDTK